MDLDQLSARFLLEGKEFPGKDVIFPQGYDALVTYLAQDLDIRFNEMVTAIHIDADRDTDPVAVQGSSGVWRADRVIVTLPIGVLKQGTVTFDPPLPPEKVSAIQTLGLGVLNKVILRFPTRFWPDTADWISYLSDPMGEFTTWLNLSPATGQPILAALNAGQFAQTLEQQEDRAIIDRAMQVLRRLYGRRIPDPLEAQITRWAGDPFARCAYSSPTLGMTARTRLDLAAPLGDRVFFAGEATDRDYPATVHGAYLSGQREAQRIQQLRS